MEKYKLTNKDMLQAINQFKQKHIYYDVGFTKMNQFIIPYVNGKINHILNSNKKDRDFTIIIREKLPKDYLIKHVDHIVEKSGDLIYISLNSYKFNNIKELNDDLTLAIKDNKEFDKKILKEYSQVLLLESFNSEYYASPFYDEIIDINDDDFNDNLAKALEKQGNIMYNRCKDNKTNLYYKFKQY